jgi:hypothetical protein
MRTLALAAAGLILAAAAPAPDVVEPWTPAGVASDQFESHAAFDPRNGDLYFVRSSPQFTGWRILVAHCGPRGWSQPADAAFAGDGQEADPWFSADGRTLWFISSRSTDGIRRKDLDLWRVDRDAHSRWATPQRLPPAVNSTTNEWFPRPSADGWLYYGSGRPGGLGGTDIWRARPGRHGAWRVENLGPVVNSARGEFEALPSPDGKSLIVQSDDGYFETHKTAAGWSPRRLLPAAVNANGTEIGAAASPSGRTVLFARDTKGPASGEFFIWRRAGREAWPPSCDAGGK